MLSLHVNINQVPWQAVAVALSLVSLTFIALTYYRSKPRIKVRMNVADPIPYGQLYPLPLFISISLTITNHTSAETSIDDIQFRFRAIVNEGCVEGERTTKPNEEFETVNLAGHRTFRHTFQVPVALSKDTTGDPSISADVTLGTDKIISTRPQSINESIFQHWLKRTATEVSESST